ncbi:PadR family transcriptional regulator [Desulfallas sp. Bu1-1]|jgi:DNA-binding PadR family transcriptional regulator|uniref:PadR family transcriptional regulator n=1 Tax=Desulfallas sp. Bu1-1 TaxID=2787620 RepID=UPI00189DF842|nr:PadR family transcriptional regulator [Desulfallas sp. Bu1-1]MBF7082929.1 PadR family transcriptional regulator [Desulfallas sp. Bu1-1]
MSLKHLILGCLLDHPSYGYKMLRNIYKDFFGLAPEVNDGQLYTLLNKMEKEGLITRYTVHQDKAPSKKLLNITEKGRAEFLRWLMSGEGENESVRFDFFNKYTFLNKCNFFNYLEPREARDKLSKQLELMESKLENLQKARNSMVQKAVQTHRIRILDYGIEVQKVKVKWLKEMLQFYGGEKHYD